MRRAAWILPPLAAAAIFACTSGDSQERSPSAAEEQVSRADGLAAFAVVQRVLQHPRCQNCHIPGDVPLQFDEGREHGQFVQRGPQGKGAIGLECATCHSTQNPPPSYGPHMPPGAPSWALPPPQHKMVFIGLSGADLCRNLKNQKENGGRDLDALLDHVSNDKLVLWGWDPGVGRAPVDVPHDEFVAAFKRWMAAGAPCPP
jgi:cytochrome c5